MKSILLTLSLVALILSRTVDRVLYTRISYDYQQYLWYFSSVVLPLGFLFITWPVVIYMYVFTNKITPEMKKFPKWKFAVMALLDCSYNLLSTFPQPYLGGELSLAISQAVLPINMFMSIFFLKTKFKISHYIASSLTIYGVLVQLIPWFISSDSGSGSSDSSSKVVWIFVALLSCVPAALSNVYKEIALKGASLDEFYTNAWVTTFQLVWGLLCFWTLAIPGFQDPPVNLAHTGTYIANANTCFLGMTPSNSSICKAPGVDASIQYSAYKEVLPLFLIFIVFNLTYNQLMLYIFKNGSSVLFVVASAVGLPLSYLLYSWEWFSGPAFSQFNIYDGFALVALALSIILYYSEKEERKETKTVEGTDNLEESVFLKTPLFHSPALERHHSSQYPAAQVSIKHSDQRSVSFYENNLLRGGQPVVNRRAHSNEASYISMSSSFDDDYRKF